MASTDTKQRIIREKSEITLMNLVQLILSQLTSISVAWKLITDSTNFFAPSAELEKVHPGNGNIFCGTESD